MPEKVIPIADLRHVNRAVRTPAPFSLPSGDLLDTRARPLHDLRISVTDRCNFRCVYCMPKAVFDSGYAFLPHNALLSFEEITRLVKVFIGHGVRKVRLTGGEPLLRKHLERLIAQLAPLRTLEGKPLDITLTTNGSLLAKKAQTLKDAGLTRVTVSLDALDDAIFKQMNDVDFPVSAVLEGIEAAQRAGLAPVKVNMVVKKGVNDQQIVPMARHFRGSNVTLRFIEYMDVGTSNGWKMDEVLPSAQVIARLQRQFPLVAAPPHYVGETANRWRYADLPDDSLGEIGVISSVTEAFCHDCTRARLSTEGKLYLCLFATEGYDLKSLLRGTGGPLADDCDISNAIASIWQQRDDRYSELRSAASQADPTTRPKVEMSYIGG